MVFSIRERNAAARRVLNSAPEPFVESAVKPDEVAEGFGDRNGEASFGVAKVLRTTVDNLEIMGGGRNLP